MLCACVDRASLGRGGEGLLGWRGGVEILDAIPCILGLAKLHIKFIWLGVFINITYRDMFGWFKIY